MYTTVICISYTKKFFNVGYFANGNILGMNVKYSQKTTQTNTKRKEVEKMKKHVIWQNYHLDVDDWKDFLNEEHPEVTDEHEQYELIYNLNYEYLNDERMNLNITVDNDILVLVDIDLWNCRYFGYRELHSNNISDCLQFERDCNYAEWYVDSYGNFKSRQSHHDGTHHLIYRAWKKDVTDEQRDRVLDAIYFGTVNDHIIRRYTESLGKYVAEVYGWNVRTWGKK